jgi:hypothetical protein
VRERERERVCVHVSEKGRLETVKANNCKAAQDKEKAVLVVLTHPA